jgi:hypothetical protein
MARNGSGVYSLPANSAAPAVATTLIESASFNSVMNDVATALTGSLAANGETTVTNNIPLAGFKLTGVGAATARTDAATLATIQDATGVYAGTVGGTADVITLTLVPALTAYAAGQRFSFIASGANTTNVTVNVNGLGAKAVTKNGTTALVAGDIASGAIVDMIYDGTRFQLAQFYTIPATIAATTIELGAGATDTTLTRASAGVLAVEGVNVITTTTGDARYMKQGLVTVPVLAGGMQAATTNGASLGIIESGTNKVLYKTLDFDWTTQEFAGFAVPFPKSYNNGTVTFQPIWTFASSSGGVVWALQALACSDGDAIDTAYGTEQTSTDTALTAGQVHVGPTSAAITIAGTPATSDFVFFRIKRNPSDGSDTLGADARLLGIRLFFTQNAADDT